MHDLSDQAKNIDTKSLSILLAASFIYNPTRSQKIIVDNIDPTQDEKQHL